MIVELKTKKNCTRLNITFFHRRVMTPPKNLTEMILFIERREKIVLECDNKAKEFTLISDNVKVLGKAREFDKHFFYEKELKLYSFFFFYF